MTHFDWTTSNPSPILEMYKKLDEEWHRAAVGYSQTERRFIICNAGCSDCCVPGLHSAFKDVVMLQLSPGEAVILLSALRNLPLQAQKEIVDRALKHQTKTDQFVFISGELATAYQHSCPLLNEDGQCSVYSARPLICRIYGLPVKQPIIRGTEYEGTQHRGHYSLACPKNRTSFKAEITYGERDHFTPNWAHRWLRAIKDAEVVQRKDALVSVPPKGKKTGVQVNLAIVLQELQNSEHYPRSSG